MIIYFQAPYLLHAFEYTPEELTARYLRWIRTIVEEHCLHGPIEKAVFTVPVSWLPCSREALVKAAGEAGFGDVELLEEPVAAGIAFLRSRRDLWTEGGLIVFDWGAGTLDLAVLTLEGDQPRIIPALIPALVDGRDHFGGDDIDKLIVQMVNCRLVDLDLPRLERQSPEVAEAVCRKANHWKIRHTQSTTGSFFLPELGQTSDSSRLNWSSSDISARIRRKLDEAAIVLGKFIEEIRTKNVHPKGILLVGGSTQFPRLKAILQETASEMVILSWEHSISAIALGACWSASSRLGSVSTGDTNNILSHELIQIGSSLVASITKQGEEEEIVSWEFSGMFGLIAKNGHQLLAREYRDLKLLEVGYNIFARGTTDCSVELIDLKRQKNITPAGFETCGHFRERLCSAKIDGRWGFIDHSGNIAISPEWDDVEDFSNDYCVVERREKFGVIDRNGATVVKPAWDSLVGSFRLERALVELNGKWGIIDMQGKVISECKWDDMDLFYGFAGDFVVAVKAGRSVLIDQWGDERMALEGEVHMWPLFHGRAGLEGWRVFKKNGLSGAINDFGIIIQAGAGYITDCGDLIKRVINGKEDLFDLVGKKLTNSHSKYSNYLGAGRYEITDFEYNNLMIDSSGRIVCDNDCSYVGKFTGGLCVVRKDGKFGVVDRNGNTIIEPVWENCCDVSEGCFPASNGEKWGYVELGGTPASSFEYDAAIRFHNGKGIVIRNEKWGALNRDGSVAIKPQFAWLSLFHGDIAVCKDQVGKFGIIQSDGKLVIESRWDEIRLETLDSQGRFEPVKKLKVQLDEKPSHYPRFIRLIRIIEPEAAELTHGLCGVAEIAIMDSNLTTIWSDILPFECQESSQ